MNGGLGVSPRNGHGGYLSCSLLSERVDRVSNRSTSERSRTAHEWNTLLSPIKWFNMGVEQAEAGASAPANLFCGGACLGWPSTWGSVARQGEAA